MVSKESLRSLKSFLINKLIQDCFQPAHCAKNPSRTVISIFPLTCYLCEPFLVAQSASQSEKWLAKRVFSFSAASAFAALAARGTEQHLRTPDNFSDLAVPINGNLQRAGVARSWVGRDEGGNKLQVKGVCLCVCLLVLLPKMGNIHVHICVSANNFMTRLLYFWKTMCWIINNKAHDG